MHGTTMEKKSTRMLGNSVDFLFSILSNIKLKNILNSIISFLFFPCSGTVTSLLILNALFCYFHLYLLL